MKRRLLTLLIFILAIGPATAASAQGLTTLGAGPGAALASASSTARVFNGTSDVADNTTGYLSGAAAFTFCMQFKAAVRGAGAQNSYLIQARTNGGNGWAILWDFLTNDSLEFYSVGHSGGTDPNTGSQIAIPDTTAFHHACWRYDGTAYDKFLDGAKTSINASAAFVIAAIATSPHFTIGCQSNGSGGCAGNYAAGAVARVYISTSALTDGQISALASPCSSSGVAGTVGYWLLGVASPDPESSPSPNTNSLTLTGTTTTTGPTCPSS